MNNQEVIGNLKLTREEQFIINCLRLEFRGSGDADFAVSDYDYFD